MKPKYGRVPSWIRREFRALEPELRWESKQERILRRQLESLPEERRERIRLGIEAQRSADRMLYTVPVNSQAVKDVGPKKYRKKHNTKIYLLEFISKIVPTERFLKIGITSSLKERFDEDCYLYTIKELAVLGLPTRKQAFDVEQRLIKRFEHLRYNPSQGLRSGGISECFIVDNNIIDDVKFVFGELRNQK